jgi:lipopolysaccharide export system permease protein
MALSRKRRRLWHRRGTEFVRIGFKDYKKQFDLSSFKINWTNDSVNKNNEKMYSMRQLSRAIDSLQKVNDSIKLRSAKDFFMSYRFPDLMDSAWQAKSVNK